MFINNQVCYFDLCGARLKDDASRKESYIAERILREQIVAEINLLFPQFIGACDPLFSLWEWNNKTLKMLKDAPSVRKEYLSGLVKQPPTISEEDNDEDERMLNSWLNEVYQQSPWETSSRVFVTNFM